MGKIWEQDLTKAVQQKNATKVWEILSKPKVKTAALTKRKFKYKESPLHEAINDNNIDYVKILLEKGISPNSTVDSAYGHNVTALHFAVYKENAEIVKLLLKHNADIEQYAIWGNKSRGTPEDWALEKRNSSIAMIFNDHKLVQVELQENLDKYELEMPMPPPYEQNPAPTKAWKQPHLHQAHVGNQEWSQQQQSPRQPHIKQESMKRNRKELESNDFQDISNAQELKDSPKSPTKAEQYQSLNGNPSQVPSATSSSKKLRSPDMRRQFSAPALSTNTSTYPKIPSQTSVDSGLSQKVTQTGPTPRKKREAPPVPKIVDQKRDDIEISQYDEIKEKLDNAEQNLKELKLNGIKLDNKLKRIQSKQLENDKDQEKVENDIEQLKAQLKCYDEASIKSE